MTHPNINFGISSDADEECMAVLHPSGVEANLPLLATAIGHKLRRAQLLVFQDFHETFAALKLRPTEFAVLALIASNPGQKQTDIAEQLSIKRANFVALMDCLENRGLAERRKGDIDRRSHSLHLTEKGNLFVTKMTELWKQHEARIVKRLGGEENRDHLISLLDLLLGSDCETAGGEERSPTGRTAARGSLT